MTSLASLSLAALLGASVAYVAAPSASTYLDADYGFQLELPDLGSGDTTQMIAHFYGPPSDDGTANVNLQVQEFEGTMDDYLETSKREMEGLGLELVDAKRFQHAGAEAASLETKGDAFGPDLHFLAWAIQQGSQVYLLTGTCAAGEWASLGDEFEASFETFDFSTGR